MPTRSLNGTTLHYQDSGQGPAFVLVHGFPLDCRIWDDQCAALSSDYRVIAVDQRGFGKSAPPSAFTIESLADDLHELLTQLGALPCVLGGLSMGGYVSLAYAKKYPTDLRGLMLLDTKAEADSAEARENRDKMIALVREKGSPAISDQMMPKMVAPDVPAGRPALARRLREIMEHCPAKTIEFALSAMRDRPDMTPSLASIPVPTLIIVGDQDAITPPAVAQGMQRDIPRSTIEIIKGSGHMSPMEQPQQVTQAMRRFLDRL